MNELADSQLEFLKRASLVSIKTREVIARGAAGSPPMLSPAAAVLQMSPRALQRALERTGRMRQHRPALRTARRERRLAPRRPAVAVGAAAAP